MPKSKDSSPMHYANMDEYIKQLSIKSFSKSNQTFGKAVRPLDPTKSKFS